MSKWRTIRIDNYHLSLQEHSEGGQEETKGPVGAVLIDLAVLSATLPTDNRLGSYPIWQLLSQGVDR